MYIYLYIGVESLSFFSSGIMNISFFKAPFSQATEDLFLTAGLISNIFEDLPQFTIGAFFLINFSSFITATSILAFASTIITLTAGILKRCLLRSVVKNQNKVIKFNLELHNTKSSNSTVEKLNPLVFENNQPGNLPSTTKSNKTYIMAHRASTDDKYVPLAQFCEKHNLTEYYPTFRENGIDLESLIIIENDDYTKLGIKLGAKAKIKNALKQHFTPSSKDPES